MQAGPDDHTVPPVVEELKVLAKERGLWNLFLPSDVGSDEPRVRAAGRADRLEHGDRPRGDQLRRPRHRQHGDAAPVRHRGAEQAVARAAARRRDPQRVRDDRARGGIQRRPQHRDDDAARRRRLRHQRPQVVDLRCRRPALQDPHRDGPHQPRRRQPSAAVDDPGARRHARCVDRAVAAGVRLAGPARALRDHLRQRAGARRRICSTRRAAVSRSPRRGWARAASTTACGRSGWPSGRWR